MAQGHCLRHTTRYSRQLENMTYVIDDSGGTNARAAQYSSWFLWPTFSFQVYPGQTPQHLPVAALGCNVAETLVYRGWYCVRWRASSETVSKLAAQDLSTTVAEDIRLGELPCSRVSASRGYRPGPLIIDPELRR